MNCATSVSTRTDTTTRDRSSVNLTPSTPPTVISRKRSVVSPGVMPVASANSISITLPRSRNAFQAMPSVTISATMGTIQMTLIPAWAARAAVLRTGLAGVRGGGVSVMRS